METLTLLGAVITASVSTLWQREELGFSEEKKLISEKIEGRGLNKKNKKKQPWFALLHFLEVKRLLSVCQAGRVGFPHLGYIESLFCYKWF